MPPTPHISENPLDPVEEIKEIKNLLIKLYKGRNRRRISSAISLIEDLTRGKQRLNGEPLIIHPFKVALKTAEVGLGPTAIIAALLHDAIEDNPDNDEIPQTIQQTFGDDILYLVRALSELNSNVAEKSSTKEVRAAQQYLLATTPDLRVIMIKLADKLHNLETIEGLSPQRQVGYIQEIKRIYLPIANFLGQGTLYQQLDDLIFEKEYPDEFHEVESYLRASQKFNKGAVDTIIEELGLICGEEVPTVEISGRLKGIASIWRKQQKYAHEQKSSKNFLKNQKIQDILAFRIITQKKNDCHTVYSLIDAYYETDPDGFDDYITHPKPNGYQSIHCVAIHSAVGPFEIQIKTQEMHQYNEYGPASHIHYKETGKRNPGKTEQYSWVKDLQRSGYYQTHEDSPIPSNGLDDSIFVLTPDKDFLKLPRGATPIDVAYEIHTEIGNQCIGALVNDRPVPVHTTLKSGDIVEIQTNPKKKFASRSWLDFVVTDRARERIIESDNRKMKGL